MRLVVLVATVAYLSSGAFAAEPKEAPPPPTPTRLSVRPWMFPPYLLLGLPRDVIDAPSKLLSSIPVFNRVFIAPLMILNTFTTVISWSFTDEGIDGGFEAWMHTIKLARQEDAKPSYAMQDRRWWRDYFPNWRAFRIVTRKPVPPPAPKAPPRPAPKPRAK